MTQENTAVETQPASLSLLDGVFNSQTAAPEAEAPKPEQESPEATVAEQEQTKSEPKADKTPKEASAPEATEDVDWEKRFKDTQKYANEVNQKAVAANKMLDKMLAEGVITQEQYDDAKVAVESKGNEQHESTINNFNTAYPQIKSYLEAQGETPDEYVQAFDRMALLEPEVMQELYSLPPEKQVSFIIAKGKELLPVMKTYQEAGSLSKMLTAARKEAVEEYKAQLKTQGSEGKPRVRAEPEVSASAQKQPKSLLDSVFG
jgi:Mn-dependent DtxR family transcriptional regulator